MGSNKKIFSFLVVQAFSMHGLCAVPNDFFLPNPSAHTQNFVSKWAVTADVMYWLASEEVSSIWADIIAVDTQAVGNIKVPGFNFKWDSGFRIGLDSHVLHDQWDTAFYWTQFHTNAQHSISSISQLVPAQEFFAGFLSGDNPRSMCAAWRLSFNLVDWELGRNYCISKRLSMRPFLGIRAGWINQSINAQYDGLIINEAPTNNSGKEHVKNNFFGIGPSGGVNSTWNMCHCGSQFFGMFGDFSTAALWGTWTCSDVYANTLSYTSSVNTKKSSLAALAFRGLMGIAWDTSINADKYHFTAKIGYEMQFWLNQLRINTFQLQRLQADLTLQGITFCCRFDF